MSGLSVLLELCGAVALLLWATRMVRTGIERAYSGVLRRSLRRASGHPAKALGVGVAVAALLQSSTVTALLTTSFVERGMLTVAAALIIMLGADVGTTLVVQALSFDLSAVTPVLLILGVGFFMLGGTAKLRQCGRVMIGLGLILLSLTLIGQASEPLRDSVVLREVLAALGNQPGLAVLLGAAMAWLGHSSVAVVLFLVSLASAGLIDVPLAFALVLGANVGSGFIALGLTWRSQPAARRVPVGNLAFRLLGVLLVVPFIGELVPLVTYFEASPARALANFHTLFNIALALGCLPLAAPVARLLARLLPEDGLSGSGIRPRYLDEAALDRPPLAIAGAVREVMRLADLVETMLRGVLRTFATDDPRAIQGLSRLDDDVDRLQEAIKLYLARVSRRPLSEEESQRCLDLITFATNLEHIGDIIDNNLLEIAEKRRRNALAFSEAGWEELGELHSLLCDEMQLAMTVFMTGDPEMARQLIVAKENLRDRTHAAAESHVERLRSGTVESIESSALHLDILRDFKRISSHLSSVAYPILEATGELRESRLKKPRPAPSGEGKSLTREAGGH